MPNLTDVTLDRDQCDQIDNWFSYHKPTDEDVAKYAAIRTAARQLALVVVANTPKSADQSAALRQLRECVATANASIACRSL